MTARARLVGDGIERPENARALLDAAAMFGIPGAIRDTHGLSDRWSTDRGGPLPVVGTAELLRELGPLLAVENAAGARSVFEATLPPGQPSVVVGNERLGIRRDVLTAAAECLVIPTARGAITTLNVASAAAVALATLMTGARRPRRRGTGAERRRPALLLAGPTDHVEAGSLLRTAAAFGWRTVALDDRVGVWFGVDRTVRAEGRAAARRHRNAIHVVPTHRASWTRFDRVVVVGSTVDGPPLAEVELPGGARTLIVVPDERGPAAGDDWTTGAQRVEYARIDVPVPSAVYRYRLFGSIALAEVSRQLGVDVAERGVRRRRGLTYESAIELEATAGADPVSALDLRTY